MTKPQKYDIILLQTDKQYKMNVRLIVEKGGNIWVVIKKEDCSYIQCLNCGEIYIIERRLSINTLIVRSECPRCQYTKGLHCGYNEMDVLELKDPYLDERYFNYKK